MGKFRRLRWVGGAILALLALYFSSYFLGRYTESKVQGLHREVLERVLTNQKIDSQGFRLIWMSHSFEMPTLLTLVNWIDEWSVMYKSSEYEVKLVFSSSDGEPRCLVRKLSVEIGYSRVDCK